MVSFHIDADLYVRVNQQSPPTYFKVHSALVAAASPVWRQQIYGGNYPRPAKGKWIINMNDDDDSQDGLDVVFSIAHYKFHDIPTRPVVEQLFEIAKIVSKYQCEHLVTPFMQDWYAYIHPRSGPTANYIPTGLPASTTTLSSTILRTRMMMRRRYLSLGFLARPVGLQSASHGSPTKQQSMTKPGWSIRTTSFGPTLAFRLRSTVRSLIIGIKSSIANSSPSRFDPKRQKGCTWQDFPCHRDPLSAPAE